MHYDTYIYIYNIDILITIQYDSNKLAHIHRQFDKVSSLSSSLNSTIMCVDATIYIYINKYKAIYEACLLLTVQFNVYIYIYTGI